MSDEYNNQLVNVKAKLDSVSPSFCAAKWKQVTMHLQNGHTHSCHHPTTHLIPIEEIKINPTALHNTTYKKMQRKLMLEGTRPAECDYCWKVEDQTTNSFSDRVYKSASDWAMPYVDDIISKPWDDNVDPSYVEVSFGSTCNFKCSYCAPHISSQWMEEIERHGPYPTSSSFNNLDYLRNNKLIPIANKDENPYVDAFWEWWPKMYKELKQFRITGGEPLLNKNTFKVLDYVIDNPNDNLELSINTNLNPPDEIFDRFIEKLNIIKQSNNLKELRLFTSAEAHGKQAEYIRFGMNYDLWLHNLNRLFKEVPGIQITIMSTYNILSIPSYSKFLADILEIKRTYGTVVNRRKKFNPMLLDIPYLRYPEHQALFILDHSMVETIFDQVTFMYRNLQNKDWMGTANDGFYENEADKLKRIYEMALHSSMSHDYTDKTKNGLEKHTIYTNRRDFISFVDEHDERRGTNFLETFPEMENFYNMCKSLG